MGTVTGAGGTPGPEALEVLRDRRVCLWPDNDEAGRKHMRRIAEALHGVAIEILWFTWDGAPDKGDAADHPAVSGGNTKAVDRLLMNLEGSPRWRPEWVLSGTRDGHKPEAESEGKWKAHPAPGACLTVRT